VEAKQSRLASQNTPTYSNMPSIWCAGCSRLFSDSQYFTQHLNGANNEACAKVFFNTRKKTTEGLSVPIDRTATKVDNAGTKRQKTIRDVEEALAASDAASKRREARKDADYSVFEYHDSRDKNTNKRNDTSTLNEGTNTKNEEAKEAVQCDILGEEGKNARKGTPDKSRMKQFKAYVDRAFVENKKLDVDTSAAIELMHLMNHKGGSLALFDAVFDWHCDNLKSEKKVTAKALHKELIERYNLEDTKPYEVPAKLPFAGVTVNLPCHDVLAQTTDLLTDPRIDESDYLFINNDPRAAPPEEWETLGDINTGRAYRETHRLLISPEPVTKDGRVKILLPYIYYLDACTTGQFMNLTIEILKFTLGLWNWKCRENDWAWRNAGYVTEIVKGTSRAETFIENADHVDAAKYLADPSFRKYVARCSEDDTPIFDGSRYTEGGAGDDDGDNQPALPDVQAQDLHKMLQVMLGSYKTIDENGGIDWDLKYGGEVIPALLVPFIMFIKCDGKEADKMTGTFQSKGAGVQCLCRYCVCPTHQSDEAYRTHALKSQGMIEDLIRKKDTKKLKRLSQQEFWNAWYDFRFGLHNKLGIHGACPMEILHWIQLGQFKYSRGNLFAQTGNYSDLSKNINGVATSMGYLMKRQSDRDTPRTRFSRGVHEGKVMAHEMTGVLLVLVLTLRSTKGRNFILNEARGKQKDFLPDERFISDWITLLETQLQFEAWLKSTEMKVVHVVAAKTKVREYMNMSKRIGKRTKGMGFKTMNHHGTVHVPDHCLDFGVPENVNTRCNKMHHKADKKTAMRTNKQPGMFDYQVAMKVHQRQAVELGIQELRFGRPRWHYYNGFDHSERTDNLPNAEPFEPVLTGARVRFFKHKDSGEWVYRVYSSMKYKDKFVYDAITLKGIHEACEFFSDYVECLWIHTELKVYTESAEKKRVLYHASPYDEGHPWHDWAMFDLSSHKNREDQDWNPAQMKAFIDLRELSLEASQILNTEPGIYAIIEPTVENPDPNEEGQSELFTPWMKEASTEPGMEGTFNNVELANVNLIGAPAIVVPDLDNENNRAYLRMVPKSQWAVLFEEWLEKPHTREFDRKQRT
jgi:hypothetical protein